jgi:hypothetical protein
MNEIHSRYVASVPAPSTTVPPRGQVYQGWTPCIEWCEKQIVDGWWYLGEGVFEFVDEADCTWFMLRWA